MPVASAGSQHELPDDVPEMLNLNDPGNLVARRTMQAPNRASGSDRSTGLNNAVQLRWQHTWASRKPCASPVPRGIRAGSASCRWRVEMSRRLSGSVIFRGWSR
jgi:hypothetical protein